MDSDLRDILDDVAWAAGSVGLALTLDIQAIERRRLQRIKDKRDEELIAELLGQTL